MIRDLKFAFRQLFKAPAFTIAAATVLALCVGVCGDAFCLVFTGSSEQADAAVAPGRVQVFSQD